MVKISFGVRAVGAVIVLIALFMSLMMMWFLDELSKVSADTCTCGDTCNMVKFQVPSYFYAGAFVVLLLFVIGIMLVLKGNAVSGPQVGSAAWEANLKRLDAEEKAVYKAVMGAGGTMFQSEIVEGLGWSKVKVTRTLDSLESRRLIERRRRGLTNIIVLKGG
jgi:hypothetical protein